jgi:hypothetical protein
VKESSKFEQVVVAGQLGMIFVVCAGGPVFDVVFALMTSSARVEAGLVPE